MKKNKSTNERNQGDYMQKENTMKGNGGRREGRQEKEKKR